MRFIGIQFKINDDDLSGNFHSHVEKFFRESRPGDVLVFPEDIGLLTAFTGIRKRSISEGIQELYSRNQEKIVPFLTGEKIDNLISIIFLSLTEKFVTDFFDLFSNLSREYGVYTIACNNMAKFERRDGKLNIVSRYVYNTAFVFNPLGNLIFQQDKVYLTQMEKDLGISPGDLSRVSTFNIEGKEIGIAISLDAFTPSYITKLQEAEIIIQPDANPVKWNSFLENGRWQPEEWMDSAYYITQRVDKTKFVINPMLVGDLLDIRFEGQSSVTKKAEGSDEKMCYMGNIPTTGFHNILPAGEYGVGEYVDRKEIRSVKLRMDEGMVEVEI
jgi:predicted amidohydrolase